MAIFLRKLKHLPQKVLIARTDRVGDFILTLPVFEAMSRQGILFSVLCRDMVIPLLDNNPFVKEIIRVEQPAEKLMNEIIAGQFDTLLVLVNDPIIRSLLPRLKFIPRRVGPLTMPGVFFSYSHPVLQKRSRSTLNEAEYNLELLNLFGIKEIPPIRPRLYLTDDEIGDFRQHRLKELGLESLPDRFIVFHQGMRGSALNWKASYYRELLEKILQEGIDVILTGAGEEETRQNKILYEACSQCVNARLFDWSDRFSLREIAILISQANVFIGPSTGPTHIANAVNTPLLSFYPPIQVQSSTRWQPYLAESAIITPDVTCGQKFKCLGEKCPDFFCMDQIKPESVFQELLGLYYD